MVVAAVSILTFKDSVSVARAARYQVVVPWGWSRFKKPVDVFGGYRD